MNLIKRCEDLSVYANFKISNHWLGNFMERYHLSVRSPTHKAQENSKKNHEKVHIISNYLIELTKINHQYLLEMIFQMEETPT